MNMYNNSCTKWTYFIVTAIASTLCTSRVLTQMWNLYLKQLCSEAAPEYATWRRVKEGTSGWGSSFVIVLVAVATKSYYPPLNPPSSTPPPAEKIIVPRCSDNCWNNNSEINGFYVLSETHFWTPETQCQDWSHQRFILFHSSSPSLAEYMQTCTQCTSQRYVYYVSIVRVVIIGLMSNSEICTTWM